MRLIIQVFDSVNLAPTTQLDAGTYRFGLDFRGDFDYFGADFPFTFDTRATNVVDGYQAIAFGVYPSQSLGRSYSRSGAFWLADVTISGRIETTELGGVGAPLAVTSNMKSNSNIPASTF